MRVRRSVTSRISTPKPGAIVTRRPGLSFPPGDTIASYVSSPSGLSSRISAGAPDARVPEQARAKHTRAVHDEHVAGAISSTHVGEGPVRDLARRAIDDHETRRIAPRQRLLRDLRRRKDEIVVGGATPGRVGRHDAF